MTLISPFHLFPSYIHTSKYKMGISVNFWTEKRQEAFKSLQEPTIFSNKICSLEAQKFLATFCYNKYYRWLTVASLGDGAFLKASRTSDLHSLGGWPMPDPLGYPSFAGMIFSENIFTSYENNGPSSIQTFYLPNPIDLTFFLL